MDLSERKLKILQAIIADFVYSAEPVGSRTISKRLEDSLSPATIRNEMADLEEMGYLTHPHTSAGRVPSDKAYRLYVDELMEKSDLPDETKNVIASKITDNAVELDKTIEHAAEVLSELTNLVSFAVTPSQQSNKLKYVNFLPVDERTVVLMVVAEDGKISNQAVRINYPYNEEQLQLLSKVMTHNFKGKTISEILTMDIIDSFESDLYSLGQFAGDVVPGFMHTLEDMLNVELYVDGYTNIFSLPEFNDMGSARNFLETMKDKEQITDALVKREGGLQITIGEENNDALKNYSLITADYRVNGKLVGKLGVIGPKRMKYGEVSSVLQYMTENITKTFEAEGYKEVDIESIDGIEEDKDE